MRHLTAALAALGLPAAIANADQASITVDGRFDDWGGIPPVYHDQLGDAGAGIDLGDLWLADDERFLFLRVEAGDDFDLSENNALRLYLDTDADAATGIAVGGIGAELEWRAGERVGTFVHQGNSATVYHDAIRFRGMPTVTSTVFEIAVGRDTLPDGVNPLFTGSQVRVLLVDTASGDMLPDAGSTLSYTLDVGNAPPTAPRALDRRNPDHLRIITHNVLSNHPFDPAYEESFERLYTAVAPDILHLQEIYDFSANETRDLVASWLGGAWHAASVNDCKTVSRYAISNSWAIDGNLAVLIDTTASIGTQMLCINAHLPCCDNDASRQDEVDAIIAFIREAYAPGGVLTLGPEVPVMIAGDLNLVGLARQLDTLLTGDIQDESTHGPDHPPDPDGTALESTVSRQTEKRMGYTWRNDFSSFWPGQLDFLIYSGSTLDRTHDFIVYTPEMSAGELSANGLLASDSTASDHLVFCADFAPPAGSCPADLTGDGAVTFADLLAILAAWGPCACEQDLDGDGVVGFADLLLLLATWGPCV